MENKKVYQTAIKKWGYKLQLLCLLEEMGELAQQVVKKYRGSCKKNLLLEEAVDVQIMLEQTKLLFTEKEWNRVFNNKLNRLKRRLKK